jgi:hypothetical protein
MAAAIEERPFAFVHLRFSNLLLRSSYQNQLTGLFARWVFT